MGAYSTRKGSTTYVTSGTTCGPSIVSVCLRAGWSIGDILQRYLKNANAGDQFCGRVVCGLPVHSHDFGTLPPMFGLLEGDDHYDLLMDTLGIIYPFRSKWGTSFGPTVMFMTASLTHHVQWIQTTLPKQHVPNPQISDTESGGTSTH